MDYYINSALRLRLFFDQPNHLAVALVMAWGVCLYLLSSRYYPQMSQMNADSNHGMSGICVNLRHLWIKNGILFLVIVASIISLSATYSRSGMVAFLVVACVLWRSRGARYWIGVSLVVWLFCLALMPEAGGRFASIEPLADKSIAHRFDVWRGTLGMSLEKPWTGFGASDFGNTLTTWHLPVGGSDARYVTAVNTPLTILGYWGYPVLFVYLSGWALLLIAGFRGLWREKKAITACFIVQLVFLVGGFFTDLHQSRILHLILWASICGTLVFHRNDTQAWKLLYRRWLPIAAASSVVMCGLLAAAGFWLFPEGYALRNFPLDAQGKSTGQGWVLVPDRPNGKRLVWFIPHGTVREQAQLLCRPLAMQGWEVCILEAGAGEILKPEVTVSVLQGSTDAWERRSPERQARLVTGVPSSVRYVVGGIGEEGLAALALASKLMPEEGSACDAIVVNIEAYWPFEEFNPQNTIKAAGGALVLAYENGNAHYSQAANTLADMGRKNSRQVDLLPLDISEGKNILSVLRTKYFEPFSRKKAQEAQRKSNQPRITDEHG